MKLKHFASLALAALLAACSGSQTTDTKCSSDCSDCSKAACCDSAKATVIEPVKTNAEVAEVAKAEAVEVFTPQSKAEATDKPLVIDFSATWCGPCQKFKPTFHKVAEEYTAKARFATVDVDECTELANKYNVSSIPFILILNPDGSTASQLGQMSEADFKAFLDKNLK